MIKIHYRKLLQCIKLGLKLKHIHRGIKFKESDWLKVYIDRNTQLRTDATNEFEKDFFKLMNNAVFGKTMENKRKRVDVRLVTDGKKYKKLVAKPNFHAQKIFAEDLVSVHMKRTCMVMNKPIYIGACILDLSKIPMYDFHYNFIKQKYGDQAKLLLTDTDSLLYEIQTEDYFKDIIEHINERFDTSNYPKNHPSGIPSGVNKKVLGMFKDEVGGKIITEFVGLRAKQYSFIIEEEEEVKKCKGIKKQVIKNNITHENYKECLFTQNVQLRKQTTIRSREHVVHTEVVNKVALSPYDDKRYILENGIDTLAWGHHKIRNKKIVGE